MKGVLQSDGRTNNALNAAAVVLFVFFVGFCLLVCPLEFDGCQFIH